MKPIDNDTIAGELRLAGLICITFTREHIMPCYLFTYHAYCSWLPDRPQGYVRRHEGILPADPEMAMRYRSNARNDPAKILADHQLAAIDILREAVGHIDCRLHFVATDETHVHALVSWRGPRTWQQNRASLKKELTIRLKEKFGTRAWLSEGASRKQVRDRQHFDHLVTQYLPSHRGWKWCERRGLFREFPATRRSPAIEARRGE